MKPWRDDARRGPGGLDTPNGLDKANPLGSRDGRHRHGDEIHAHLEPHPHIHGAAGAPSVGIVGAGPVGTALGVAISRAGWPVRAVASRDAGRREQFRSLVPAARAFVEPAAVLDEVELAILAVPDDAISSVIEPLRLYSGQMLVHTSGLLGAEVLESARAAGSQIGAFHPLVSFTADVERSVAAIQGSTIALEGDDRLMSLLADLAEAIGGMPVRLPPGSKAAYHAAAVLASGGLVALLDAIVTLGAAAGLDEPGALAVYGQLIEQTLANARGIGVAASLTGPITRGDGGTLEAHLATLTALAPDVLDLYLAAARREVRIAEERGTLSPEQLDRVRRALAKVG
ncbi:MAG: Rossmann-like and DUF2520 domain-containing protein [Candidatus Limnocylindrales bacterium]